MSTLAGLIPVTQKASNVCAYCRVRKQGCDRTLPRCQRCAAKGRHCDYTSVKELPRHEEYEAEPLILHSETCSHSDLSQHGTAELLRAVREYLNEAVVSMSSTLSELVYNILGVANVNLETAIVEFGPCIQQWCPIVPEDLLWGRENDISQHSSNRSGLRHPLHLLCLWLVTRRACADEKHLIHCELYQSLKKILALLQTRCEVDLERLQVGMLIAVYEVGHGLQKQAFQTLATCTAMLRLQDLEARQKEDTNLIQTVEWLKASMLMLDRMIPLSTISNSLPLTILSSDPISKILSNRLGPTIPPHSPRPFASSPRKVHIRTAVALASGHVLEYIHARCHNIEPEEPYDDVDKIINDCIKMLVDKPQPHTWLHCDAIAMAFCSHILLQASQMQYLSTILPEFQLPPDPLYIKAHLALKYSRRMAWDMVRVAIDKIENEAEIPNLPFAGLCAVLRAGLAVLETKEYVAEDVIENIELEGYLRIMRWFSGRWNVSSQYLKKAEELLGRY
ncbi:hypothetical protein BKA66DRAFT_98299 [Pyrenochaeta sp. MPI-SDFR-AT-0127]|nr:hypothetical protein BKA66DRAFT_98299 [Pyrenochaeta sp. MPI-SDFR-AT-0127]